MAKPATVERDTYLPKDIETARTLRLVKDQDKTARDMKSTDRTQKPDAADDIDDMWDNVPV